MGQERQESFRAIYQRRAVLNVSKYSHYTKNNEHRPQLPRCLKAWVSGRWLEGTAGSNPVGGMTVWSLVSVVCCQEGSLRWPIIRPEEVYRVWCV